MNSGDHEAQGKWGSGIVALAHGNFEVGGETPLADGNGVSELRAYRSSTAAAGVLLVLAGCAPAVVRGAPDTASGSPPPRVPVLKAVEPCSLLTAEEAAGLGLPPGRPDQLADLRQCWFNNVGEARPVRGSIFVDEGPGKGVDDLKPPGLIDEAGVRNEVIAGYATTSYPDADGMGCLVNIDVNTDENVTVQSSLKVAGQPESACAIARKMVGFIAPRLPKK
ncbi:DUF3558 family protein [Allokutzneria oryzae]|uniref:DUF3558 family protein n=1 Tax=Allokutzneria oryzae TaxID=1378989 RepID=A0ABV5ZRU6_9PSEU